MIGDNEGMMARPVHPGALSAGVSEGGSDARELFDTFFQHKWMFALVSLAGMVLAAAIVFLMTPLYTAQTTILVTTRHAQVVDLEPVLSNPSPNPFLLQSQLESEIEMIRSYPIVIDVVNKLKLTGDPEFNPLLTPPDGERPFDPLALPFQLFGWLKAQAEAFVLRRSNEEENQRLLEVAESQEKGVEAMVVANVLDRLDVAPRGRSMAITLSFTSLDPVKAATIVDALAQTYVRSTLDAKTQATRDAIRWLSDRVTELRIGVAQLNEQVERYRQEAGLEDDGLNIHAQTVAKINEQLVEAQIDASVARERVQQVAQAGSGGPAVSGDVLGSPLVQNLRIQETALMRREQELTEQYGPKHPSVLTNRAEIQSLRRQMGVEIAKIRQARENELMVADARVAMLKTEIARLDQESQRRQLAQVRLKELKVEADAKYRLYEGFLRRHHEISQQVDIQQPDAAILSPAKPPLKPSSPRKALFLSASLLLSMIVAASIVVLIELLKKGFKNVEDVERGLQVPMLGIVPRVGRLQARRGGPEDYLLQHPGSLYSESIRNLRTTLRLMTTPLATQTVLFTSALRNEGKSAIAISYARMAARAGQRVVIIDCDLRRPRIHKALGQRGAGLADHLEGEATIEEIIRVDGKSGLSFITGGTRSDSPAELLERPAMRQLVNELGAHFDLVVLDSPPVLSVADARLLARLAQDTVYVVEWHRTSQKEARLGYNLLRQSGAEIVGVVLSKASPNVTAKYGYQDNRWGGGRPLLLRA